MGIEITAAAGRQAPAGRPAARIGAAKFLGEEQAYWRLLIRGALMLTITFGVYRFWLATDVRRFLWANTEIAGDSLEYTGTATELLLGFLIAIVLLLPIYAVFFIAALDWGLSALFGFLLLTALGHFAVYRARRYRLTRTVYRGVHFRQTGSGGRYALYAVLWWTAIAATAGLAYPWAQASLERLKMRNTYYGHLRGHFDGSALSLFLRSLPIWVLIVGPLLLGLGASARGIDWTALLDAVGQGGSGLAERVESGNPGFDKAIVFAIAGCIWAGLAAATLYPAFQALLLRWRLSGLGLDAVAVTSHLRTGAVYRAYFRFLLYGVGFAAVLAVAAIAVLGLSQFLDGLALPSESTEVMTMAIVAIGYLLCALGFSTIYQGTVKLSLWRLGVESLALTNIAALGRVKAAGKPSSALGEGLADALNLGGF
jgi:uncharacterized membrane protein YjgN (DUF898 family)